jgi:ABC-type molybdenum transport system ATPase subunit/photorepair protein PhrA
MRINHLLDLPSVSLSSGQTRRARIAAALLSKPVFLVLEDPMAGLDVGSREEVSRTLGDLNAQGDIRIAVVQRGKGVGDVPDWVTDICEVRNGEAWIGSREEWVHRQGGTEQVSSRVEEMQSSTPEVEDASEPIIQLQDVSVSYGEGTRPVSHLILPALTPRYSKTFAGLSVQATSGIYKAQMVCQLIKQC